MSIGPFDADGNVPTASLSKGPTPLEDFILLCEFIRFHIAEGKRVGPGVERALERDSRIRAILEEDEHRKIVQDAAKASEPSLRKAWEDEEP